MKTVNLNSIVTNNTQIAALKLFHSVVDVKSTNTTDFDKLIKYGILLIDNKGLVETIDSRLADLIINTLGLKTVDWTESFHKSWDKVATASIDQLVSEQILNYFSTYGLESLGLESLNFVPVEKILVDLDTKPSIDAFTVVRLFSIDELKSTFIDYLTSTKAPHRDAIEYIRTLLPLVNGIDVDSIKSFEIKIMYCDLNNVVPVNAQDFLRFMIYKASNGTKTTIVKDNETINLLKIFSHSTMAENLFAVSDLDVLSESFYRFKPLFLAFKSNHNLAPIINKIRRLAVKNHKPITGFTVSNLMNLLAQNRKTDAKLVISKADNRELVKLINFATFELNYSDNHIYNIRNGKMFVKVDDEVSNMDIRIDNIKWLSAQCKAQLISNLGLVFNDYTFYIPNGIKYVAPVSEKQMLDTLPYGSKVYLPKDAKAMCISGHWMNNTRFSKSGVRENGRIDLDFHMNSAYGSIGWNSNYRNNDILFSGDMTNAPEPNGAVESFRINANIEEPYELSINIYNGSGNIPYELLFTKDITSKCDFKKNSNSMISAVVNPKNAIAPKLNLHVQENGAVIGFYHNNAFTIYGGGLGGNRHVPDRDMMISALNASIARCDNMMDIIELISLAGGNIVHDIPKDIDYIDLSTGNLTPSILFDIVDGKTTNLPITVSNKDTK